MTSADPVSAAVSVSPFFPQFLCQKSVVSSTMECKLQVWSSRGQHQQPILFWSLLITLQPTTPFLKLRILLDNVWLWVESTVPQCGILHVFQ